MNDRQVSQFGRVFALLAALFVTGLNAVQATGTWSNVPIGPLGFVDGMVISPVTPSVKYIRTDVGGAHSWNSASSSWTPITDNLGAPGVLSIAADPLATSTVYIATNSDIYSVDQGARWTALGLKKSDGTAVYIGPNDNWRNIGERLAVDPNDGAQPIYLGSQKDGLWRTLNGGTTWSQVTSLPSNGVSGAGISFVVFDNTTGTPTTPSQGIYVGVIGSGVYYSSDGGTTWQHTVGAPTNGGPVWIAYRIDSANHIRQLSGPGHILSLRSARQHLS